MAKAQTLALSVKALQMLTDIDTLEDVRTAWAAMEQLLSRAPGLVEALSRALRGAGLPDPRARGIEFVTDAFIVHLEDGRSLTVPLDWFPRLRYATAAQRTHYEVVGRGVAIHWPDIDEDISVPRLFGLPC